MVAGDALALPFADRSFDAATIAFGLRNVADVDAALRELARVTRPGGRLVVCEFSRPTWAPWRTVYTEYLMRARYHALAGDLDESNRAVERSTAIQQLDEAIKDGYRNRTQLQRDISFPACLRETEDFRPLTKTLDAKLEETRRTP